MWFHPLPYTDCLVTNWMIILFIIFVWFLSDIQETPVMFLMYIHFCEIFVSIYLYLKIFKNSFLKKTKQNTFFHTLDIMELYLIITTSHLTSKDPEVSWPELLWTPTGSISHRVFVSLVGEVPLSGGSILSRVPWNPSASSWFPLILINQLQSLCVFCTGEQQLPGSEGKCQQSGTRTGAQVVNVSHCDRWLWPVAQAPTVTTFLSK